MKSTCIVRDIFVKKVDISEWNRQKYMADEVGLTNICRSLARNGDTKEGIHGYFITRV